MKMRLVISLALFGIWTPGIFGNPVDPSAGLGVSPASFVALITEALVISALLAFRKFHFLRILVSWLFVTQMTYWYMKGGMLLDRYVSGWDLLYDPYWLLLIVMETLVVLIEAWIILKMSESRFFRDPETVFSKAEALGVAVAGNAVSLGISLLWRSALP